MSIDANKAMVERWFRCIEQQRIDDMLAMMAEGCRVYDPHGDVSKAEFGAAVRDIASMIDGGVDLALVGFTAEADRVAVEVEGSMLMKSGKRYQNKYHWLFIVTDGLFSTIREYTDTMPAAGVFDG